MTQLEHLVEDAVKARFDALLTEIATLAADVRGEARAATLAAQALRSDVYKSLMAMQADATELRRQVAADVREVREQIGGEVAGRESLVRRVLETDATERQQRQQQLDRTLRAIRWTGVLVATAIGALAVVTWRRR